MIIIITIIISIVSIKINFNIVPFNGSRSDLCEMPAVSPSLMQLRNVLSAAETEDDSESSRLSVRHSSHIFPQRLFTLFSLFFGSRKADREQNPTTEVNSLGYQIQKSTVMLYANDGSLANLLVLFVVGLKLF